MCRNLFSAAVRLWDDIRLPELLRF